jgi:pimeloyl-ACP methyl ester carboxylesterase
MPFAAGLYYHECTKDRLSGHPVILLHGAGGTHLYWPAEVRRMNVGKVYALDLPGHGHSDRSGCKQDIAGYALAVMEWMYALHLPAAIIVGHSMGGAIALNLALDFPEHVSGLGLVATAARLAVNPCLIADTAHILTYHKAVDAILNWSFSKFAPERLVQLSRKRMEEGRPSVLHSDLYSCDQFDVRDRVELIACPSLVISGSEDRMVPLRHAQYLASAIPNASLQIIPNAGHMVMLEEPKAVAQALGDFVRAQVLFSGEQ